MKTLVGCVYSGSSKAYALGPWLEMMEALFEPMEDVDVCFAVDREGVTDGRAREELFKIMPGEPEEWATVACHRGKALLRDVALADGYDVLVWQGVDCYYTSAGELEQLLKLISSGAAAAGALVAGRNRPDYPVCRVWEMDGGKYLTSQREVDQRILASGNPMYVAGYPGSDATAIARRALEPDLMLDYEPWHIRKDSDPNALGPDDFWFWRFANERLGVSMCHPGVRPWHAHEDGWCARWPHQRKRLEDLSWTR